MRFELKAQILICFLGNVERMVPLDLKVCIIMGWCKTRYAKGEYGLECNEDHFLENFAPNRKPDFPRTIPNPLNDSRNPPGTITFLPQRQPTFSLKIRIHQKIVAIIVKMARFGYHQVYLS